jgi:hypothetical protein
MLGLSSLTELKGEVQQVSVSLLENAHAQIDLTWRT